MWSFLSGVRRLRIAVPRGLLLSRLLHQQNGCSKLLLLSWSDAAESSVWEQEFHSLDAGSVAPRQNIPCGSSPPCCVISACGLCCLCSHVHLKQNRVCVPSSESQEFRYSVSFAASVDVGNLCFRCYNLGPDGQKAESSKGTFQTQRGDFIPTQ